jgi:predicted RNA binding protein YcfA (HicA-like mRNA interferase family)
VTKIPRNLNGRKLCDRLSRFGYFDDRHHGDHYIMTTLEGGEHHVDVPQQKPLKVGTLSSILKKVAAHFGLSVAEVLDKLDL